MKNLKPFEFQKMLSVYKKSFSAHLNVVRTNVDLTTAPVCSFVDHLAIWQSSLPFKLGNLTVLTIWQSSPLSNLTIRLFWQFDNHLCFQTWQFDCFGNVTIISAFKLDYLTVLTILHIHFPIRNMIVSLFLIPFVRIILISETHHSCLSPLQLVGEAYCDNLGCGGTCC